MTISMLLSHHGIMHGIMHLLKPPFSINNNPSLVKLANIATYTVRVIWGQTALRW